MRIVVSEWPVANRSASGEKANCWVRPGSCAIRTHSPAGGRIPDADLPAPASACGQPSGVRRKGHTAAPPMPAGTVQNDFRFTSRKPRPQGHPAAARRHNQPHVRREGHRGKPERLAMNPTRLARFHTPYDQRAAIELVADRGGQQPTVGRKRQTPDGRRALCLSLLADRYHRDCSRRAQSEDEPGPKGFRPHPPVRWRSFADILKLPVPPRLTRRWFAQKQPDESVALPARRVTADRIQCLDNFVLQALDLGNKRSPPALLVRRQLTAGLCRKVLPIGAERLSPSPAKNRQLLDGLQLFGQLRFGLLWLGQEAAAVISHKQIQSPVGVPVGHTRLGANGPLAGPKARVAHRSPGPLGARHWPAASFGSHGVPTYGTSRRFHRPLDPPCLLSGDDRSRQLGQQDWQGAR